MFAGAMMMKAAAAGGNIQFVGGSSGTSNQSSNNAIVDLTSLNGGIGSAAQAGDLVIAISTNSRTSNLTGPRALTAYAALVDEYSSACNFHVDYKLMGGTPDTSVEIALSGSNSHASSWVVFVFRGVDQTTPFDVATPTANGSGTTDANPPTITPATTGAMIVASGGGGGTAISSTYTQGGDLTNFFTERRFDNNGDTVIGAGLKAWTGGAFDPAAFSGSGGVQGWWAATFALRPA
jgi:hypothetical protein